MPLRHPLLLVAAVNSLVARIASVSDWGGETPRQWQRRAMSALATTPHGERAVVTAVMGAGKARFAAELCRRAVDAGVPVVLSTSTVALVDQLAADVANRVGSDNVGRYYTHGADVAHPVIVTCIPSMPDLATELARHGRAGGLWIADEAHKTESAGVVDFAARYAATGAIGLSATPYRSEVSHTLTLWDREVFRYSFADALRDGVLVPFRLHFAGHAISSPVELDDACAQWIARQPGCGIVDAKNIGDAVRFAARLSDDGIAALPIHSKLTTAAKRTALARLKAGDLKCLVHVNMLTEGVDIPFLTWGCLRRRRSSRVANAQHVGRYLRSHPGKTHADLFDPWEILPAFGLDSPAALGEALDVPEDAQEVDEAEPEIDPATGEECRPKTKEEKVRIARMGAAVRFLAAAAASLRSAGVANAAFAGGRWREKLATAPQIASLSKLTGATGSGGMAYALRQDHRAAARAVGFCAHWYASHPNKARLRAGILSDLQTVMYACHRAKVDQACAALEKFGVDPAPVFDAIHPPVDTPAKAAARQTSALFA